MSRHIWTAIRSLLGIFRKSRFSGLIISPSPLIAEGWYLPKRHGREVEDVSPLASFRSLRDHGGIDEIVVNPADWHEIMNRRLR